MSRLEKETIILFNEEESTAEVFTYNHRTINRLNKLCEQYPDEYRVTRSGDEFVEYICPKSRIHISAPRKMSDEQKEMHAENLKNYRQAKNTSGE